MPPLAILFDFDGVIADTENIHIAAWERTFDAMGYPIPEDCSRAAEVDDRTYLRGVFEARGIGDGDIEGWVRRKQATTLAMMADSPRIYPGVADLLLRLRGRACLAVVSTTWLDNIATVLRAGGLSGAFDTIVGKEDVSATKPDPECYRLALDRLRVAPRDSLALEDSAIGLASARAAGIRTLAIGHRSPRGEWCGDSPFLPALADVPTAMNALVFPGEP